METKLLLIRHGVTSWHAQSRVIGQNDVPLDEEGHSQARMLATALSSMGVTRLLSSPLVRAAQTACALKKELRMPVTTDSRLTDLRVGEWEGLTYSKLSRREDYRRFLEDPLGVRIPGGETLEQGCSRALAAVEEAIGDAPAGGVIAVVTHSDIVRLLLCHYQGVSLASYTHFSVAVASVSTVSLSGDGKARVLDINWRPSLQDSAAVNPASQPVAGVNPARPF